MRQSLNALMAIAFVASAVVQYNDPDPIPWVVTYLLSAALCVGWARDRVSLVWFVVSALTSLLTALFVVSAAPPGTPVWSAVGDWQMNTAGSEVVREAGGLLLVATWMAVLAGWSWSDRLDPSS